MKQVIFNLFSFTLYTVSPILRVCVCVCVCACVCVCTCAQWCLTLYNPLDGSLPGGLLCPWNFPGKNTRAGCHFLRQRIFLTQGSNLRLLHLPHWQAAILPLVLPRKPITIRIGCVCGGVFFFTVYRFAVTLHQAKLLALFFQQHLLTSSLCVTFW